MGTEINSGTVAGCIEFLGYTIRHGYLNANTASSIRTGVNKVVDTVGGLQESSDVRSMDVDDVMSRFRNLARGQIKDESAGEYERRFRQARDLYIKFLDGDDSWKKPSRPRASSSVKVGSRTNDSGHLPEPEAPNPALDPAGESPAMIQYPFPIRPGIRVVITLPDDLTSREAKRVAAFISTLAVDDATTESERRALTAGN